MQTGPNSLLEDHTLIAEAKLYYDLLPARSSPAPLVIALHGYGANKRQMMREARQLVPEDCAVASLQGFHQHLKEPKEPGGPLRFGFGWLTNFHPEDSVRVHHKALLDLVGLLIKDGIADAQRIFLLGFSQSCALNYRFAFTHPDVLRWVIGICGGLPGDWETNSIYQPTEAAIFHLAGMHDEFYPPSRVEDYAARLRLRALDVEFNSYDAAHEITDSMRRDVSEWLGNRCR